MSQTQTIENVIQQAGAPDAPWSPARAVPFIAAASIVMWLLIWLCCRHLLLALV